MKFSNKQTIGWSGGTLTTTQEVTAAGEIPDITDESALTGETTRMMTFVQVAGLKGIVLKTDQDVTMTPNKKHVETATVVGTIGPAGAGNATVVVTAVGMTGSPKTLNVAVANDDTASQVAGKIRTALAADADVIAFFDVGGANATATLTTRIPVAADATRNISVDNGTCTGLSAAPTSVGTLTAGGTALELLAGQPYVWMTGDYNDLLPTFSSDIFSWDVTNASGETASIIQHGLVDPTP